MRHLTWTGRTKTKRIFRPPPNSFTQNELNIYLIFLVSNAFKKGGQFFLLSFFSYCLQLFSAALTNDFKRFLGSHTPQSHLDELPTKQLKKRRSEKKKNHLQVHKISDGRKKQ